MMLPLDLLRTLLIFSESDNILDAARKLGLSQPAVSVQLKKLEDLLPQPVFTIEGKKKTLTHYGRALVEELRGKLTSIDRAVDRVNQLYSKPENITLKIGVRTELFYRVVEFIKFPGRVQFLGMSNRESIAALLNHDIDIAITHQRPDLSTIYATKLFSEGVKIAVHRKFLGGKDLSATIAKSQSFLSQVPFLAYKEDSPFIGEWLKHAGVSKGALRVLRICEDWRAIMAFVELQHGFSIMPRDLMTLSPDVTTYDVPYEICPQVVFYALYHEDLRRIPSLQEYLKF